MSDVVEKLALLDKPIPSTNSLSDVPNPMAEPGASTSHTFTNLETPSKSYQHLKQTPKSKFFIIYSCLST